MDDADLNVCIFSMPYPPSVNGMYSRSKHGVFVKDKVRLYKKEVFFTLQNKIIKFGDKTVSAYLTLYPPDKRHRDIDNILKVTFDCLQLLKVVNRDSQICHLELHRREIVEGGRLDVIVHSNL